MADTSGVPVRHGDYQLGEEIASSVVHGLGAVLSLGALVLLTATASSTGDPWRVAAAIIFGTTLLIEYTASTLYHALPGPRAKHVFKVIDHAGIYLLIAGSYTPFALVTLRGQGGVALFVVVWLLAAAGVAAEAFWTYRPRWVSVVLYLAMGWMGLLMIRPLIANLEPAGLWLLIIGGILYTLGTIFYVLKRVPYFHAIWHGFVVAASVCQFLAVWLFVLPA
jgi:hemolysin III